MNDNDTIIIAAEPHVSPQWFLQSLLDPVFRATYVLSRSRLVSVCPFFQGKYIYIILYCGHMLSILLSRFYELFNMDAIMQTIYNI
jgi:hypothetical protein